MLFENCGLKFVASLAQGSQLLLQFGASGQSLLMSFLGLLCGDGLSLGLCGRLGLLLFKWGFESGKLTQLVLET